MSAVHFVIPGVPVPQGSKNPWGGEDNPHTRGWRQSVADRARELMHGEPPLRGPVLVEAEFTFPRPKSHYRTGRFERELRAEAPIYHVNMPDLDKLQRAIGDALAHVVLLDDKQIAAWNVRKIYGNQPQAELWVIRLPVNGHQLRLP